MSDSTNFSPPKSWIKVDLRHSFMIFSILLLGVIFITSLVIVDYLIHEKESKTFFYCFLNYLRQLDLLKNFYIITPLSILILYGLGLSIHLISYFYVSAITMFATIFVSKKGFLKCFSDDKLNEILKNVHSKIATEEKRAQKREFLYLTLQRHDTPISSDLKFVFIQLIYARTISFIFGIDVIIYLYHNHHDLSSWIIWLLGILILFLIWIIYIFNIYHFEHMLRMSYYADKYTSESKNEINTNLPNLLILPVGDSK